MIYAEECKTLGMFYYSSFLGLPYTFSCFLCPKGVNVNNCIVTYLGVNLKPLVDAAENYQIVLAENRKLFNEVQELKGSTIYVCPRAT